MDKQHKTKVIAVKDSFDFALEQVVSYSNK